MAEDSTWYGSALDSFASGIGGIWDSATGAVGSVFDEAGNAAGGVLDYGLPQWLDFGYQPSLSDRSEQFSGRFGPVDTIPAGYTQPTQTMAGGSNMSMYLLIGGIGLAAVVLLKD